MEVCPEKKLPLRRSIHRTPDRRVLPRMALSRQKTLKHHDMIGTVLAGKYRIDRLIGYGGMGEVFEAENLLLRRPVAIKIVANAQSEQALVRLCHEAHLVSAMQHPNICDIYDLGSLPGGAPYLVLERLFGETLGARLERERPRPLANGIILSIFTQILSGLDAAHSASIVHRDLKPENVFLTMRRGCPPHVKLLDFGFAKDLSGLRAQRITRPGDAVGTPRYMAPEQMRGEAADRRTDFFAVGLMLFESLTGTHPFEAPTLPALQRNVLREPPMPLTALRPDLSHELEMLLDCALARDPARRFASASAFSKSLQRVFRDLIEAEEDEEPVSETAPMETALPLLRDASPSSGGY
jgi:eukaryotic-like serine/threonine-protein kinase